MLSNLPELFRYYLQFNNIKHKVARTLESVDAAATDAAAATAVETDANPTL
jgi:hypothetical protein